METAFLLFSLIVEWKKYFKSVICELFKKVVTKLNASSLSMYLRTGLRFITIHNVKIPE